MVSGGEAEQQCPPRRVARAATRRRQRGPRARRQARPRGVARSTARLVMSARLPRHHLYIRTCLRRGRLQASSRCARSVARRMKARQTRDRSGRRGTLGDAVAARPRITRAERRRGEVKIIRPTPRRERVRRGCWRWAVTTSLCTALGGEQRSRPTRPADYRSRPETRSRPSVPRRAA
jgi:hypothetical protein